MVGNWPLFAALLTAHIEKDLWGADWRAPAPGAGGTDPGLQPVSAGRRILRWRAAASRQKVGGREERRWRSPKETRLAAPPWFLLLGVPFLDVIAEIGLASSFPQLRELYGSPLRASLVVSVSPLLAVGGGWFWGRAAVRRSVRRVFRWAAAGWTISVALLAATIDIFPLALGLRSAQGFFSAGFAALPFIAVTRITTDRTLRARLFGRIETAVSAGAILAPITVGIAFSYSRRLSLLGLASLGLCCLVAASLKGEPPGSRERGAAFGGPGENVPAGGPGQPGAAAARVHRAVALPALFAALVAAQLGALETLIPQLGEEWRGSVLTGKGMTMLFEVAVVLGILVKARWPGVGLSWPVATTLLFGAALFQGSVALRSLVVLLLAGIPIGASITMGNELAARWTAGAEEVGMGLYSTLRITGSFVGPLFMNIPYPTLLVGPMLLGVTEVATVITARSRRGRRYCRWRRYET